MKFNNILKCLRVFVVSVTACASLYSQDRRVLQEDKPKSQQTSVDVAWIASTSADVFSYNIFRSEVSGGPYNQRNERVRTETSFTDHYVIAGDTYCYVATAVDTSGNQSAYSNESCITIAQP